MKKLLPIPIALLLICAPSYLFYKFNSWSFPKVVSAYYAKEFCSCIYIERRGLAACHDYAAVWIPISSFKWHKKSKLITVVGLSRTSSAQHISSQLGCRLID
ncbi:MAG: amidase [Halobacteriovoraceae bacterium]|nr:amidase [Halobacteriovoraceae bacterium]